MPPLVSVFCLCYNHAKFLNDAVESVINQTYKNIELIIVNDASKDNSIEVIEKICKKLPFIKSISNKSNLGMCLSFNKALREAKGDYIIDLAADDILLPERIEKQVKAFDMLDASWGVVFSDAIIVNNKGEKQGTFYKRGPSMELQQEVISGDIFSKVVKSYQICSPTIMVRKDVIMELGGYDPSLIYEDYDFFIRSSRNYKYYFIDEPLTIKRNVKNSDSTKWYNRKKNPHLESTLKILKKYLWLCKNEVEINASLSSIRYHMRQSLFMECYSLVIDYYNVLKNLKKVTFLDKCFYSLASTRIPLYHFYSIYRSIKHKL